jgi:hypothetical protein
MVAAMRYIHATFEYTEVTDLRITLAMRSTLSLILREKTKTKNNFLSVTKEPNCENGMDQRYLRAISNCVFQETKKSNSFQNLGLAWNITSIAQTQVPNNFESKPNHMNLRQINQIIYCHGEIVVNGLHSLM